MVLVPLAAATDAGQSTNQGTSQAPGSQGMDPGQANQGNNQMQQGPGQGTGSDNNQQGNGQNNAGPGQGSGPQGFGRGNATELGKECFYCVAHVAQARCRPLEIGMVYRKHHYPIIFRIDYPVHPALNSNIKICIYHGDTSRELMIHTCIKNWGYLCSGLTTRYPFPVNQW